MTPGNHNSGRKPLPIRPTTIAGRHLIAWLDQYGYTRAWLCRETGIDPSRLRRLLTGEGSATLAEAFAIEHTTGCEAIAFVDAGDWLEPV